MTSGYLDNALILILSVYTQPLTLVPSCALSPEKNLEKCLGSFFLKSQWLAAGLQIVRKNKVFLPFLICKKKKKILELFVYPILATLPMGFSWQEYWNGSPCIPSENLLDPPRDQIWDSCISCGAGMLFPEPLGSPSAFCYFLDFDPSRIRVELAERSFMTKMDRYTTVNW